MLFTRLADGDHVSSTGQQREPNNIPAGRFASVRVHLICFARRRWCVVEQSSSEPLCFVDDNDGDDDDAGWLVGLNWASAVIFKIYSGGVWSRFFVPS
ncbi:hypothetical protein RP20_CCG008749 [Aedes albopictus]|nr:hypothetical protein RP20_CCG014634 [Aedes albopictus]KXJ76901.1 hypothetical protein RP20_CCG008749 [Aedes albopictus]